MTRRMRRDSTKTNTRRHCQGKTKAAARLARKAVTPRKARGARQTQVQPRLAVFNFGMVTLP